MLIKHFFFLFVRWILLQLYSLFIFVCVRKLHWQPDYHSGMHSCTVFGATYILFIWISCAFLRVFALFFPSVWDAFCLCVGLFADWLQHSCGFYQRGDVQSFRRRQSQHLLCWVCMYVCTLCRLSSFLISSSFCGSFPSSSICVLTLNFFLVSFFLQFLNSRLLHFHGVAQHHLCRYVLPCCPYGT